MTYSVLLFCETFFHSSGFVEMTFSLSHSKLRPTLLYQCSSYMYI